MPLTFFFAQLIGLFCLIIGVSMLFQKKVFIEVVNDIVENRAIFYTLGLLSLFIGLVIILTHTVWNAGFLALLITLCGWIMVVRGILALFASHTTVSRLTRSLKIREYTWLYALIIIALGTYLTIAGFAG